MNPAMYAAIKIARSLNDGADELTLRSYEYARGQAELICNLFGLDMGDKYDVMAEILPRHIYIDHDKPAFPEEKGWEFKFTYVPGTTKQRNNESAWCDINETEIDWTDQIHHGSIIQKVSFRRAR